jgi:polyhydroxyalkanoate synthase subunit PhaC
MSERQTSAHRRGPHPLGVHLAMIWQRLNAAVDVARGDAPAAWRADLAAEASRLMAEIDAVGLLGPGSTDFAIQVRAAGHARMEEVLKGVRSYQHHPYQRALPPAACVAQVGDVRVLDFGGTGRPALFVPSLINPSWILDLAPGNSMMRWLACQNIRPLLLDWGAPVGEARSMTLDDYTTKRLLPLLAAIGEPVALVGYCLGGTLAVAAAQLAPAQVERLAGIAAPWDFAAYAPTVRTGLQALWSDWQPVVATTGVLPMEALQLAFAGLDPSLMERKFRQFARLDPSSVAASAFVALEDWANQGPAMAAPAAHQLVEGFYRSNLPASGAWRIGDIAIQPSTAQVPSLTFISLPDRIVPKRSALALAHALPRGACLQIPAGHVGMIGGSRAADLVWRPLAAWLAVRDF